MGLSRGFLGTGVLQLPPCLKALRVGWSLESGHTGWDLASDGELKSFWLYPLCPGASIDLVFPNFSPNSS